MGAAIQQFMDKFEEFKTLPSGESFTIEVTDQEVTAAANEYVTENKAQIKGLLKEQIGFDLNVEKPSVEFRNHEVFLSILVGMGFLKTKALFTADVTWDGKPVVVVQSVDVPLVSVSPEELNSIVEEPLTEMMGQVEEYAEIRSFELKKGLAVVEAVRK